MPSMSGLAAGPLSGLSANLNSLLSRSQSGSASGIASAGNEVVGGPGTGTPLGRLTVNSSPREVAAAIITRPTAAAIRRSRPWPSCRPPCRNQGLRPNAVSPNRAWVGIFQQDTSYPAAGIPIPPSPSSSIALTSKGKIFPEIYKTIFWLQQAPGHPSAEYAYSHGRQHYLAEIMSQQSRAAALYRSITSG